MKTTMMTTKTMMMMTSPQRRTMTGWSLRKGSRSCVMRTASGRCVFSCCTFFFFFGKGGGGKWLVGLCLYLYNKCPLVLFFNSLLQHQQR